MGKSRINTANLFVITNDSSCYSRQPPPTTTMTTTPTLTMVMVMATSSMHLFCNNDFQRSKGKVVVGCLLG